MPDTVLSGTTGVALARNKQSGPTVFTDRNTNTVVEWAGAGDPQSGDVQEVNEAILKHPQFRAAVRAGVFELINADGDEADAIMDQQMAQRAAARADQDQGITDVIEQSNLDQDFIPMTCLSRGCENQVVLLAADLQERPPLCDRHEAQASEFKTVATGNFRSDGKPEVEWVPASTSVPGGAATPPTTP